MGSLHFSTSCEVNGNHWHSSTKYVYEIIQLAVNVKQERPLGLIRSSYFVFVLLELAAFIAQFLNQDIFESRYMISMYRSSLLH
jgi:hypothetical protein